MKKLFAICAIGLMAAGLLSGCPKSDDGTKKELADLKEQLAQQQKREAERNAQEMERQQAEQIESARQEGYQTAQEELQYRQMLEEEEKKLKEQQNAEKAARQKVHTPKVSERLARYPAFVISESGWGQLNLRGAPSAKAVSITELNDGDQVMVIGETNSCTPKGCWVKIQANGMTGYVNSAFLQKGRAPADTNTDEGIY